MQLKNINPGSKDFATSIDLTPSRLNVLGKLVEKSFNECDYLAEALSKIAEGCENNNELAAAAFYFGANFEKHRNEVNNLKAVGTLSGLLLQSLTKSFKNSKESEQPHKEDDFLNNILKEDKDENSNN